MNIIPDFVSLVDFRSLGDFGSLENYIIQTEMAYNEILGVRINKLLKSRKGIVEKKMFGGIAFMMKDKMFCGIIKDDLMVRVLEEKFDALLKKPHAREMDFAGRPMRGFLYVSPDGIKTDKQLMKWIELGIEYVLNSPPKKRK